jgi:predicted ester cyclase
VRRYVLYNYMGFPDLHFELHETIAQGDKLVIVWTVRGTHKGRVMNIPPTGVKVEARGISVLTIQNGKITRSLRVWDVAGMLRHIGLLPDLPTLA